MKPEMKIDLATARDEARVVELLAAQLAELDIETPRAGIERAAAGLIADAGRGFILVARDGERLVGVAYVAYTWSLEHGGKTAWLEELYVVPELRGGGVGRALLLEAQAHAARNGCAAMDLEVAEEHGRAATLYGREGWHELRRARWVKLL